MEGLGGTGGVHRRRRRCRAVGVLLAALAASAASAVSAAVAGPPLAGAVPAASAAPTAMPPSPPSLPTRTSRPSTDGGALRRGGDGTTALAATASRQSTEEQYNEQAAAYERERQIYCRQYPFNPICSQPPLQPLPVRQPPAEPPREEQPQQQQQSVPNFFTVPPEPPQQESTPPQPRFFTPPPQPTWEFQLPPPEEEQWQQMQQSVPSPTPTPEVPSPTPTPDDDRDISAARGKDDVSDGTDGSDADDALQQEPQSAPSPSDDPGVAAGANSEVVASSEVCLLKDEWDDYLKANEKALAQYEMPAKERDSFTKSIKELPTKVGEYHCFRDQAEFDYMGELVADAFSSVSSAQMTERVVLVGAGAAAGGGGAGDGALPGDTVEAAVRAESCASRANACTRSWRYGCTSRRLCCCPSFCVGYFDTVFSALRITQSTRKRSTSSCCISCFC